MNKLILVLTFFVSTSLLAHELPSFSAFVSGDNLHLTMMVDNCNSHGASLKLASNCVKADTADYVTTCKAEVQVRSTRMACRDMAQEAQTFTLDLKSYNLRKTISTLELSYYDAPTVEVDLTVDQNISAFVVDKELQLTVMADSCNGIAANLMVDKLCDKDRLTRNRVVTCHAYLSLLQTAKACNDPNLFPKVLPVDLEKTQVAPEAITLDLSYGDTLISVDL